MSEIELIMESDIDLVMEGDVIELVIEGGRGSIGPPGTVEINTLPEKTGIVGGDIGVLEDSEDPWTQKKWTFTSLVSFLLSFFQIISSVKNHGTISSAFNINPNEGTEHTGDFSVNITATLTGFTEEDSSIVFLLEKTGAGTATISLAVGTGAIIFIGANNLTDLEANTYMFVVQYFSFPDPADDVYAVTVGIKP